MTNERPNIGILTFSIAASESVPLSNLVNVVYRLSNSLCLIALPSGNDEHKSSIRHKTIHTCEIRHRKRTNMFARTTSFACTQFKMSCELTKLSSAVDLWIFFIGGESLVLPMLTAKLLRKKVVIASAGSGFEVAQAKKDPLARVSALLQNINYRLVDRIIVYSDRLVEEHALQSYRDKISIAHEHFLDFGKFKVQKQFNERRNSVGYIGALSRTKGVPNLLEAIPTVLAERGDAEFVIGGKGQLQDEVGKYLKERNLNNKVKFLGWVAHDELPSYLNELKLLVLPSYTEGLPNIILEAMACGTPVLATPVGAIPDVIKDGGTGFIMQNNSPECIAENIIRALNYSDLGQIANNACALVEREFTFEKAVERYENILDSTWV